MYIIIIIIFIMCKTSMQDINTRTDTYIITHFYPIPDWNNLCIEDIDELDLTQFRCC